MKKNSMKKRPLAFNRARALARFTRLRGRGVTIELAPSGIVVNAESPEELERETDREIVKRAGDDEN